MATAIKAIETKYDGYRFRSRLEARWAVFFKVLGVPFEYEPEGFVLSDGTPYLPDFWLPTVGLRRSKEKGIWLEIKGQMPTADEDRKCELLAKGTGKPVILMVGAPCRLGESSVSDGPGYQHAIHDEGGVWWDNYMHFQQCRSCRHVKVEFMEGGYMVCPLCNGGADDETEMMFAAREAARSARFGK